MANLLDRALTRLQSVPWSLTLLVGAALALAPFSPEPHLWEKLKMWHAGNLQRAVDMFDLAFHASGLMLIALKLAPGAVKLVRRHRRD